MIKDVKPRIRAFILKTFPRAPAPARLRDDLPLFAEAVMDSLGLLLLARFLEKEFGVRVAPKELLLSNFKDIDAIAAFVSRRLPAKPRRKKGRAAA